MIPLAAAFAVGFLSGVIVNLAALPGAIIALAAFICLGYWAWRMEDR